MQQLDAADDEGNDEEEKKEKGHVIPAFIRLPIVHIRSCSSLCT